MCTPTCLLAASISVESVTPPLVGWACKELLLFCAESRGKSNDGCFSAISSQLTVLGSQFSEKAFLLSALEPTSRHDVQPDTGSRLEMVIGDDEMDLAGSLTEVAVKVTLEPLGTVPGAW